MFAMKNVYCEVFPVAVSENVVFDYRNKSLVGYCFNYTTDVRHSGMNLVSVSVSVCVSLYSLII